MQGAYFATHPTVQLPPGWQQAYTAEGQVYYVDHATKTTHWHPPQMSVVPQVARGGYVGGGVGRGGVPAFGGRGGRIGIDGTKRKTKICMNWESGSCSWGDRCAFAHGATELCAQQQQDMQQQQQYAQQQQPQAQAYVPQQYIPQQQQYQPTQ